MLKRGRSSFVQRDTFASHPNTVGTLKKPRGLPFPTTEGWELHIAIIFSAQSEVKLRYQS